MYRSAPCPDCPNCELKTLPASLASHACIRMTPLELYRGLCALMCVCVCACACVCMCTRAHVCVRIRVCVQTVRAALAAGKHVIEEKPLSGTVKEALHAINEYRRVPPEGLWLFAENYRLTHTHTQTHTLHTHTHTHTRNMHTQTYTHRHTHTQHGFSHVRNPAHACSHKPCGMAPPLCSASSACMLVSLCVFVRACLCVDTRPCS